MLPTRQSLLQVLEHALRHSLKSVFEASPGRIVTVAFLNSSLNSFLPPLNALRHTSVHGTER